MLSSDNIVKLYNKVLDEDILNYNVPESAIRIGIKSMNEVYKPSTVNAKFIRRPLVANYTDVAHRCAYLHKYASLHTAMVRDLMFSAIRKRYDFFKQLFSESSFKMCSLGGGPGSDVVGVLASLMGTFNHRHDLDFSATVIDLMAEWSKSFKLVMKELESGKYGSFLPCAGQFIRWCYMGANLLESLDPEVKREISSASLITAIKFVSAANCKDTEFMVNNIFSAMKPGAVIFFIDNAGGGCRECILNSALKFNFIPIIGPIQHVYHNEAVRVKRFDFISCFKTIISVAILQKPYEIQPRLRITFAPENSREIEEYCSTDSSTKVLSVPISDTELASHELKQDDHASASIPNTAYSETYSGKGHHPTITPSTSDHGRSRIPTKNGCLPASKIKHWRHHLSTKLDSFKSRIQKKCGKNKRSENDPE